MKTLIVKNDDLSIASAYEADADQSTYGGPWGDSNQYTHVTIPDGMKHPYLSVADVSGVLTVTEDATARADAEMSELRIDRDMKLKECDWTQLADVALGVSEVASWATYRQELRDITGTYSSLDTVVWPTEPAPEV